MIVITGASDGLGHELAKVFKADGKTVVNISRRECSVADHNLLHDLSKGTEITAAVKELQAIDEPLELLINNAGVWSEEKFGKITEAETERAWAVNLRAPILLTSELMDRIRKDGADVMNIVSQAGRKADKDYSVYNATKWGERGFTEALRQELKDTPSRVIGVFPGGIKTKIFSKTTGSDYTDDGSYWMDPVALAGCLKQLFDLPKGIEVAEIVLDRKKGVK
jgi:short-subunit dehydrogenase